MTEQVRKSKKAGLRKVDFSALTGLPVEPNTLIQETKVRLLA